MGPSKVVYEGWMVRYGRRMIGRSFIHMRYFVLESRLIAYYKRKPQDNQVPIKTLVVDGNCRVEDRGLKTHHGHRVYILCIYNKKDKYHRITMAAFNIQEALIWKEKIEQVLDQHQESQANGNKYVTFEYNGAEIARNASSSDHDSQEALIWKEKIEQVIDQVQDGVDRIRLGETVVLSGSSSFTSHDDDASSSKTDPVSVISPNGTVRANITYWEKGDLLGQGSFGKVYKAISSEGFFFAVKEVSFTEQGTQGRQSVLQLEQEIDLLSQFEHKNIVRYLGTDKDDSTLYVFLELVTQGSLVSLYKRYNLRDSQVSAYTRRILYGLQYLHDRRVVHRDIKCANILVAANGRVKLADFGLAKATKLNDLKSCKGTPFWMAPEVVNQKNNGYGLLADIWSVGCTVLEMLTRHVPYHPLEPMPALYRIGMGIPPPIPPSLSRDARDFIMLCLQANPSDRPSAADLLHHPFVRRPLPTGSESPLFPGRWVSS